MRSCLKCWWTGVRLPPPPPFLHMKYKYQKNRNTILSLLAIPHLPARQEHVTQFAQSTVRELDKLKNKVKRLEKEREELKTKCMKQQRYIQRMNKRSAVESLFEQQFDT